MYRSEPAGMAVVDDTDFATFGIVPPQEEVVLAVTLVVDTRDEEVVLDVLLQTGGVALQVCDAACSSSLGKGLT